MVLGMVPPSITPPITVRGAPRRLRITGEGNIVDENNAAVQDPSYEEKLALLGMAPEKATTPPPAPTAQQASQDESWRTLAPARETPKTYDRASEIPRGAGNYLDMGGKFVPSDMDSMMRLAAGGDPAAMRRALDDYQLSQRAKVLGHGGYSKEQEQAFLNSSAKMFGDIMGASQRGTEEDTKRAQAAIMEYGQKVRGPQEDALKGQLERERNQVEREKIRSADKVAVQTPLINAALQKLQSGATPSETEKFMGAAGDLVKKFKESAATGTPSVAVKGAPPNVAIDGSKTTQQKYDEERQATEFLQKIGARPLQAGDKKEAVKFNPELITEELARNPALARNLEVQQALLTGFGGKTPQEIESAIMNAFMRNAYEASRGVTPMDSFTARAIPLLGAPMAALGYGRKDINQQFGDAAFHYRPGWMTDTFAITGPEGNTIHASDITGPLTGWWHGLQGGVPSITEASVAKARDRATAISPLVKFLNEARKNRKK